MIRIYVLVCLILIFFVLGAIFYALAEMIRPGEQRTINRFIEYLPYGIFSVIASLVVSLSPLPVMVSSFLYTDKSVESNNYTDEKETDDYLNSTPSPYITSNEYNSNSPYSTSSRQDEIDGFWGNETSFVESSKDNRTQSNTYPGCVFLERGKTISADLSGNGNEDTFSYTADIIVNGKQTVVITINGRDTSISLRELNNISVFNGICAADINLNDAYRNIIIFQSAGVSLYAYNDTLNLTLIGQLAGTLDLDSIDGLGNIVYYHTGVLRDSEEHELVSKYTCYLSGETFTNTSEETGIFQLGTVNKKFVKGFSYRLTKDTPVYNDELLEQPTDILIPTDTFIEIVGYYPRGGRPITWTYHIKWDGGEGWIGDPEDW